MISRMTPYVWCYNICKYLCNQTPIKKPLWTSLLIMHFGVFNFSYYAYSFPAHTNVYATHTCSLCCITCIHTNACKCWQYFLKFCILTNILNRSTRSNKIKVLFLKKKLRRNNGWVGLIIKYSIYIAIFQCIIRLKDTGVIWLI